MPLFALALSADLIICKLMPLTNTRVNLWNMGNEEARIDISDLFLGLYVGSKTPHGTCYRNTLWIPGV